MSSREPIKKIKELIQMEPHTCIATVIVQLAIKPKSLPKRSSQSQNLPLVARVTRLNKMTRVARFSDNNSEQTRAHGSSVMEIGDRETKRVPALGF